MPKQTFKRNQIVFKEGDECAQVFVVLEGEFEISKWVCPEPKKDTQSLHMHVGPERERCDSTGRYEKHK
jgi:hypothetical protein